MSQVIFLLLGGGDLASGVALRLHRAGLPVLITELAQPLAVRRRVAFSEAVYQGRWTVEGVTAQRIEDPVEAPAILQEGMIPVLVDPELRCVETLRAPGSALQIAALIDGRMAKRPPEWDFPSRILTIGLGPGFVAGSNCHAVVETQRGHTLGRVIWDGPAQEDTGIPERVGEHREDRVLRAPVEGLLHTTAAIGDHLESGQLVAMVDGQPVLAQFRGVLRGLLPDGIRVRAGMKIGDVDPRDNPLYCRTVSDKSLAVGGGVLEALLSRPELRLTLCS